MLPTFRESSMSRLRWNLGMMATMERINPTLYGLLQFLLLHPPLLLWVPLLQPMIALLPMHVLLLLVGMPLQLLMSLQERPLIGASRTFLSSASRLISMCHSNDALIHESHQQMCQCFLHRQDIGWLRSRVPIPRWSCEL
jgi:hypothetical protein